MRGLVLGVVVLVGCAHHPARPTFASDELYAHVRTLNDEGRVTLVHTSTGSPVVVRRDQVLETTDHQQYAVAAICDRCTGIAPESDECTLAALAGVRFVVHDEGKIKPLPGQEPDPGDLSWRSKVLGLGALIAAPLIYGEVVCEFSGCKALLGVPLLFDGLFMVIALLGMG